MAKQQNGSSSRKNIRRPSSTQRKIKKETKSYRRFLSFSLKETFNRDRVGFIFGLLFFFIALYSSVAVASFLFTGGDDQSIVRGTPMSEILLGHIRVRNLCGPQGAYWSEFLFNGLFGLGVVFVMIFFFSIGLKLMGVMKRVSFVKRFVFCGAATLWLSVFAGWLESLLGNDTYLLWGGTHGYQWAIWLQRSIGQVGIVLLMLLSGMIISVYTSSRSINYVRSLFAFSWTSHIKFKPRKGKDSNDEDDNDGTEKDEEIQSGQNNYLSDDDLSESIFKVEQELQSSKPNEHKFSQIKNVVPHATTLNSVGHSSVVNNQVVEKREKGEMIVEHAPKDDLIDERESRSSSIAPGMDLVHYKKPSLDLLNNYEHGSNEQDSSEIEANKQKIISTLDSFKMRVTPYKATIGPTVTLYEVVPDAGIKISRIRAMEDDIAMSLKSEGVRIIAPMPGKGTIGIEVPNSTPQIVSMKTVLASKKFDEMKDKMELPVAIGKTITNEPFIFDLTKMPHLLIAGATGQGKSVGLNAMITSLLYSKRPEELKFVMVDPKMLEFSVYEELENHYLAKLPDEDDAIITDMTKVVPTLNSLCIEMDNRYRKLTSARVRNIKEYNDQVKNGKLSRIDGHEFLPYIVLIVDEFADLIMTSGKEVETPITRIAQKARAAGIHMVIATQRPSTDIITGIIKANFPARIAFKVFSMIDSRTILDAPGANQLIGRGDMLFYQGKDMIRLQCAFMDTPESEAVVSHIKHQESFGKAYDLPEYVPEGDDSVKTFNPNEKDALFEDVARMVVNSQIGSTSNIQRKFNIGYNRAGRLMDQLEAAGIVSPQDGSKPRDVLIKDEMSLDHLFNMLH
ncbi:FtsK/SpoIIIE family DNA translocase [Porphyromonas pogonae]|uniref:FtsK/SpoIIIE family DNA translocase n=1 Tax=Porphyromonas pogonae TaxID=867595 RepID=UPI002E7798DA|nr:DNA translocase FtsK 4TM domain-containing protein [Porphyromonas pogonae]